MKDSLVIINKIIIRLRESMRRRVGQTIKSGQCICVICGCKSPYFLPYFAGSALAPVNIMLNVVGSDLKRYACPKCGSNDRERHLKLYFEHSKLRSMLKGARILHFAPERCFGAYVLDAEPLEHVKADLFPKSSDVKKIDMLKIDFPEMYFDVVIANHVLEHVANDRLALSEICRVLKPGGVAILQTPFSDMLQSTFEDPGIATKVAREFAYGQDDHVRLYGRDIFSRISATGLTSRVRLHQEVLGHLDVKAYGVNPREPFFLFERT